VVYNSESTLLGSNMDAIKVDIREFRDDLTKHIASSTPVAVMQDGQTVGYFIPTQKHNASDVTALSEAREAFDQALGGREIDIEEAVAEFDALRKNASQRKRSGSKAA
jgi:hypothetical protein